MFAGIDLNGAVIKQDSDGMRDLYGRVVPFKAVLLGKVPPPETTRHFLAVVQKWATPSVQATNNVETAVARR
jgi:lipid-binding SYLF domain-containing protein